MSHHTINGHDAHVAHHFDGPQHQFDSGKLGMWAFLAQEVLFFSALFVAYIVFRYNHPEVFAYAHKYLDVKYGAINTAVLIFSSLSAAWAVRAAQKNQQKLLIACLATTILCAFAFLGIKYIEYSHKFHIGTVYGCNFAPNETPDGTKIDWPEAPKGQCRALKATEAKIVAAPLTAADGSKLEPGSPEALKAIAEADKQEKSHYSQLPPPNTSMFFSIYFAMTGLHGIHVLVGIGVFIWLLVRAIKGHFSEAYFGPIDFAALYWHIVDLIWILSLPTSLPDSLRNITVSDQNDKDDKHDEPEALEQEESTESEETSEEVETSEEESEASSEESSDGSEESDDEGAEESDEESEGSDEESEGSDEESEESDEESEESDEESEEASDDEASDDEESDEASDEHHGDEHHGDEHHGDGHHGISHVASSKVLLGTFGALMVLTIITVAATSVDLGSSMNLLVAMIVATIKAGLVCMFFMHLRYDKVMHTVAFLSALLFALLFVSFALMDSSEYQQDIVWVEEAP